MPVIRVARLEDIPLIQNLAHQTWPDGYGNILSAEQLEYMLEKFYSTSSLRNQFVNLHHNFILVLDENVPVGFASFSSKETNISIHRLHKIYVLPTQQGTGTGKLLLDYVIEKSRAAGAIFLELNVNRNNKARHFYEKQGFKVEEEADIDIGNGFYMNDYIMRLQLP
ncbi:MAG: GNAT family N-acetyltransferase [Ginsengibacter sp.]